MSGKTVAAPAGTLPAAAVTDSEKYDVLDKIGHGSFGIIRKVRRKTDGEVLCRKEIQYVKMSQKEREQLHAEFSILSSLRHSNIVAYYHRDHLKATQELHLYMEYCGGGDLGQVIKELRTANQVADEAFVWSVVAQLAAALYRCHVGEAPPAVGDNVMAAPTRRTMLRQKNQVMILHRDLKPENVFLGADGSVKLGDFGLSKLMQSHDFASTYVGTPFYMSPEICAAERYTSASDIWSLGCIIYELCCKTPPFNAKTHFHLVQKIKDGRFDPLPAVYSPELTTLVRNCLQVNPQKRPDTWDLLQLPVVRLLRKEREVVDVGAAMKRREERALAKAKEAEALLASLEESKQAVRAELEDVVRREWEVKARLEIDRQVAMEKERLEAVFEAELRARVEREVEHRVACGSLGHHGQGDAHHDTVPALSSISTASSTDGPSTDASLSLMDSPAVGVLPPKPRSHRTPFARARTTVDSPMDIAMASPSPISIAGLSLSPRHAAALKGTNLFVANADARARWEPQTLADSDSEADHASPAHAVAGLHCDDGDDEDDMMHSPTAARRPRPRNSLAPPTMPSGIPDPFKTRPGLARQRTVPSRRPGQQGPQAPLFAAKAGHPPKRSPSPTSPQRRIPRPLSKAATTVAAAAAGGDADMVRVATSKNHTTVNFAGGMGMGSGQGIGGRTLVELQQARAGIEPSAMAAANAMGRGGNAFGGKIVADEDVAQWDADEDEEMPSPFLCRVRRDFRV